MQLIVLGMHRSGTSVLARMLNLMGAYFGPEGASTGANQENPKGFWERRDIRALNDAVLHSIGCDWNRVHDFDVNRVPPEVARDFETRAFRVVMEMDAHRPWLMKEPRLCLLFPLWRRVFEVPFCIHIFRHPVEVASSLQKRNGIPIEAGLALWEKYVRSALAGAYELPGVVVSHRELMTEPSKAVTELFEQLVAQGVPGLRMPSTREIDSFVEPALHREHESRKDLRKYSNAPQVTLFERIMLANAGPKRVAATVASRQLMALAQYEQTLPPLAATRKLVMPESREQVLNKQLATREQEDKAVKAAVEKIQDTLTKRFDNLEFGAEKIGELKARLSERIEKVRVVETELQKHADLVRELRQQAPLLQGKLAQSEKIANEAQQMLLERSAKVKLVETELQKHADLVSELRQQILSMREKLAQSEKHLEQQTEDLKRSEILREGLERDLSDRFTEVFRLTKMLMAVEKEHQAIGQDLLTSREQVRARDRELLQAQARLLEEKESNARTVAVMEARIITILKYAEKQAAAMKSVTSSVSWRVTSPLRAVRNSINRRGNAIAGAADGCVGMIRDSGLFDEAWYRETYPDVTASGYDPIAHYCLHGAKEGRDPSPGFSTSDYLSKFPELALSQENPLLHYIEQVRIRNARLATDPENPRGGAGVAA